jgi:uncharacterized repeat protein (TIGR01451 family)
MKNIFITCCLLFVSFTSVHAQWQKVFGKNYVPYTSVFDQIPAKYQKNLCLTDTNGIYFTRDEGTNWRFLRPDYFNQNDNVTFYQTVLNEVGLFSIANKRTFFLQNGLNFPRDSTFILFTPNFGVTWEIKHIPTLFYNKDYSKILQSKDYVHFFLKEREDYAVVKMRKNNRSFTYSRKYESRVFYNFFASDVAEYIGRYDSIFINYHDGRQVAKPMSLPTAYYFIEKDSLLRKMSVNENNVVTKVEFSKDFGSIWYEAGRTLPLSLQSSMNFFSDSSTLFATSNGNLYASLDNGLNWTLESKEVINSVSTYSIQDSVIVYRNNSLIFGYNVSTKKTAYYNTANSLDVIQSVSKLPDGKLLTFNCFPNVNFISNDKGTSWKYSVDYPYYFDRLNINDSITYLYYGCGRYTPNGGEGKAIRIINNIIKDTINSPFPNFSHSIQKGDTIILVSRDTIRYAVKPYTSWSIIPNKKGYSFDAFSSLLYYDNKYIYVNCNPDKFSSRAFMLIGFDGSVREISALTFGNSSPIFSGNLLSISKPRSLWFSSYGTANKLDSKDSLVIKTILIPNNNDEYVRGFISVKKDNEPEDKIFLCIINSKPYISSDFGKTWSLFNLSIEKELASNMWQIDSFLFINTNNGLYKRSTDEIQFRAISGIVFNDSNGNNQLDSGEKPIINAKIESKVYGAFTYSDSLGRYTLIAGISGAGTDTIKAFYENKFATISPVFYIVSQADSAKNFAIKLTPSINDVKINATAITPPRPGFNNEYHLNYKNVGSTTLNGNVSFNYNVKQNFVNANAVLGSNNNQILTFPYTNLQPNENRTLKITFKTAVDVPVRSSITNIANITPLSIDTFKADNVDTLVQTVVGSYDPNDKQVTFNNSKTPPSLIDPNTELIYTIRFQNTGNYPADFVKVVDTLSDKLDVSTFRMIAASHNYTVAIRNKNALVFDFNPIYLPDSVRDEKGSHGFVKFAIKPKKTLTKDEAIKNTGFIYFDYNPAIVTNTVETANLRTSLFTPSVSAGKLDISPNPTQNIIKVEIEDSDFKEGTLSIYDLSGRLMLTKSISNKIGVIDVSHLGNGEYICTVKSSENKVFVSKFVKL